MQTIKAADLFKNIKNIDSIEFDNTNNINIDFSNINSIDFKGIKTLLNIQKVAVLNNKKLFISNLDSQVKQTLDVTGLGKNFCMNTTNPIKA